MSRSSMVPLLPPGRPVTDFDTLWAWLRAGSADAYTLADLHLRGRGARTRAPGPNLGNVTITAALTGTPTMSGSGHTAG